MAKSPNYNIPQSLLKAARENDFDGLLNWYIDLFSNRSPKTQDQYRWIIVDFFQFANLTNLSQINEELVVSYIKHEYKTGVGQTPKTKIQRVIHFLKILTENEVIQLPILTLQTMAQGSHSNQDLSVKDILDTDDKKKLKAWFASQEQSPLLLRWHLFFSIGMATGIRLNEMAKIRIEEIKKFNGQYFIHIPQAKRGKSFDVPLPDRVYSKSLIPYLQAHGLGVRSQGWLFFSPRDGSKPITNRTIENDVQKVCNMAGIDGKNITPHSLRHTFGTDLAMSGMDLIQIKEAMHHSTVSVTEKYIHLANSIKNGLGAKADDLAKEFLQVRF